MFVYFCLFVVRWFACLFVCCFCGLFGCVVAS